MARRFAKVSEEEIVQCSADAEMKVHLHLSINTDEAQKVETVLSAVSYYIYIYIYKFTKTVFLLGLAGYELIVYISAHIRRVLEE